MGKKILSKEVELEHILPRKASSVLLWGNKHLGFASQISGFALVLVFVGFSI